MIVVIIAGGSGSRLWPVSTPDYPKHLLNINGEGRSLLQSTYDRATLLSKDIFVVSEKSHAHHVREQLPEIDGEHLLVEPARRGTASCITSLLVYLSKQQVSPKEPIAILFTDHHIRDTKGFVRSFEIAAETSKNSDKIVLIGIEPTYPATGFGYIKKSGLLNENSFVFHASSFKEKPDYETSQKYIKSGEYLWNGGYFVGSLNTFVKSLKLYSPALYQAYNQLKNAKTDKEYETLYLELKTETIDHSLLEHVPDLLVVPASFDWMDIGSFSDLHKAVESNAEGNHTQGQSIELEGVTNSFVRNYEEKPLVVMGLDNVVVVNTPNGLIVARKDLSQKVGDISKRFSSE